MREIRRVGTKQYERRAGGCPGQPITEIPIALINDSEFDPKPLLKGFCVRARAANLHRKAARLHRQNASFRQPPMKRSSTIRTKCRDQSRFSPTWLGVSCEQNEAGRVEHMVIYNPVPVRHRLRH